MRVKLENIKYREILCARAHAFKLRYNRVQNRLKIGSTKYKYMHYSEVAATSRYRDEIGKGMSDKWYTFNMKVAKYVRFVMCGTLKVDD